MDIGFLGYRWVFHAHTCGVHHLAHFHQLVDNDDNMDHHHLAYHLAIYIQIVDSVDMSLALAWYPLSYDAGSILLSETVLSAFLLVMRHRLL